MLYVCIDGDGGQETVNVDFVLFIIRQQGVLVMSGGVELVGGLDRTG